MSKPKLGVIVPYRDRYEQLFKFKTAIHYALSQQEIPYELVIVEQDNEKIFNRGKLLNIGVLKAKELECEYIVLHDIDMLPTDVDYKYSKYPIHLATQNLPFPEYFGGITLFPINDFIGINGFSNEYWGWGFEDDDLLFRARLNGLKLDTIPYKAASGNTSAFKFNGNSAYIKVPNKLRTRGDFSITVTAQPEEITYDHLKDKDNFTIFGIPGYDFNIMYTSFGRFTVELFDSERNHHYLNTKVKPPLQSNITVTWDTELKELTLYFNGVKECSKIIPTGLRNYQSQKHSYIGASFPARKGEEHFFKGRIQQVAIWNSALSQKEVHSVATNKGVPLGMQFGSYKSQQNLQHNFVPLTVKDYKVVDLGKDHILGVLNDVEIVPYKEDITDFISIPFRRTSKYRQLEHGENGFLNTGWKDITTRYNQLKFMNEVKRGYRDTSEDGINNLKYKVHSIIDVANFHHLTVKL
tara:strand:- start:1638 stop:3038 length:1401 start_codon:yes stop_codon:yes gene_type:complete